MFDGTQVILESYSRILKRNSNQFRSNFRRGEVYSNGFRGIDCRSSVYGVGGRNSNTTMIWEHGDKIFKSMKTIKMKGLSGNISFDDWGFRRNFSIDIVRMTINSEMTKVRLKAQMSETEEVKKTYFLPFRIS